MKLNKTEIILIIAAAACVVLAVIGMCIGSVKVKTETIIFSGYEYDDISKLSELNLNYEYKEENYIVYKPFTHLKGAAYLHLLGVKNFDNKVGFVYNGKSYKFIDGIDGEYPKNDKEVLLPEFLNTEYKIGDKINLNVNFYKKEFNSLSAKEPYTVTYDQELCNSTNETLVNQYKEQEVLEEYTIVGFYKVNNIQDMLDFYKSDKLETWEYPLEIPVFTKIDNIKLNDKIDYISNIEYKRFNDSKYKEDIEKFSIFRKTYTTELANDNCNMLQYSFRYKEEDKEYLAN